MSLWDFYEGLCNKTTAVSNSDWVINTQQLLSNLYDYKYVCGIDYIWEGSIGGV